MTKWDRLPDSGKRMVAIDYISKEYLKHLYFGLKLSTPQISEIVGSNGPGTIQLSMRYYGLDARTNSEAISLRNTGRTSEESGQWKGKDAGYGSLHDRIKRKFGRPKKCEMCGTTNQGKTYDWANLTGDYANLLDYKRMCRSCHRTYDYAKDGYPKRTQYKGNIIRSDKEQENLRGRIREEMDKRGWNYKLMSSALSIKDSHFLSILTGRRSLTNLYSVIVDKLPNLDNLCESSFRKSIHLEQQRILTGLLWGKSLYRVREVPPSFDIGKLISNVQDKHFIALGRKKWISRRQDRSYKLTKTGRDIAGLLVG